MTAVDRTGWRKLMIICMLGTITCHITYGLIYHSTATALKISYHESTHFGANSACHAYLATSNSGSSSCMTCYYDMIHYPGTCVAATNDVRDTCKYATLNIESILQSMGTVPWTKISDIYPLRYQLIKGGISAVANWSENPQASDIFLLPYMKFLALLAPSFSLQVFHTEEVELTLENGFNPHLCHWKNEGKDNRKANN
ncbi:Inositol transporter 4 [Bienertia sinuspersici]